MDNRAASIRVNQIRYSLAKQVQAMRDADQITVSTDYGDLILTGEHAQRVTDRIEAELQRALKAAEKAVMRGAA